MNHDVWIAKTKCEKCNITYTVWTCLDCTVFWGNREYGPHRPPCMFCGEKII